MVGKREAVWLAGRLCIVSKASITREEGNKAILYPASNLCLHLANMVCRLSLLLGTARTAGGPERSGSATISNRRSLRERGAARSKTSVRDHSPVTGGGIGPIQAAAFPEGSGTDLHCPARSRIQWIILAEQGYRCTLTQTEAPFCQARYPPASDLSDTHKKAGVRERMNEWWRGNDMEEQ